MHTHMTVVRKRPEVSTQDFRRFMETEYGPIYVTMPQVKEYVQYYLADRATDGVEEPIDAIVLISFDSEAAMAQPLATPEYRRVSELREAYLRDTSTGIHSALLEQRIQFV